MDLFKRRLPNHTEIAYREAVAKLKYLLAESYAPRVATLTSIGCKGSAMGKQLGQIDEYRGDEELESATSDASKRQDTSAFAESTRSLVKCHSTRTATNNNNNNNDKIGVPPAELSSFIDRQEEYIEQLEKESQYCREELKALVDKVREVIAENEALQDKNKTQFFRSHAPADSTGQRYEGPSIVFESRISELEAQLTQTRLELRKAQEDSRSSLTETRHSSQEQQHHQQQQQQQQQLELERATREKHELEAKLDEYQRELARLRSRDADVRLRSKRATEVAQQAEYQKVQAELEISRLKDELERRQDKLREALQETNRRIVEEKQQVERRFSQQMEQLSADVVSHWEAASKSHLEAEKHKRQLADLARDLAEKQALVDDLTNDLRQKTTSNAKLEEQARAITIERDAAREQVANLKLAAETSERQTRQEQGRVQSEINSYKARLERTEDELAHARREHVRLTEEIAALEKEINMNKIVEETRVGVLPTSKLSDKSKEEKDKDKELAALIYDLEGKHASSAKTVAELEDSLSKQASLVLRLTNECQSLTRRLETNNRQHKEEMASLQSKIEYLSSIVRESLEHENELDKANPSGESRSSDEPLLSSIADDAENCQQNNQINTPSTPCNRVEPRPLTDQITSHPNESMEQFHQCDLAAHNYDCFKDQDHSLTNQQQQQQQQHAQPQDFSQVQQYTSNEQNLDETYRE